MMNDPGSDASSPGACNLQPTGHWRVVPLLMMLVALGHFNRIGMSVAGTERIIPQYGILPHEMGLVYSAFLVIYTLAMVPGGWFGDRFGPRARLVCSGLTLAAQASGLSIAD